MPRHMETAEKLTECLGSHASFKAKHQQGGHDQADKPGSPCLRFPKRRFGVAISAIDRLEMAMHTAFGKAGAIRQAPDALLPCSRMELKMTTLLAHNPMVSVRALKGG